MTDETPQPRIERAKPVGRPPLTLPDRLTVHALHARGYSDAQIARALNLQPSQCRSALDDARAVLEASAVALVTDYLTASDIAARKGDHRPARDMLDRLHVTEPTPVETTNVGIAVQISGFTLPGLPVQMTGDTSIATISQATPATNRELGIIASTTPPQGAPAPAVDMVATPARSTNQEQSE